ncbi:dipeptidyl aminopeptidase/acylaminoacyl peptidase [Flavobacterium sp. 90]|uniref:S9 family peptidase n=1 Tax=unclassified Flavobacterium TaxID=196869 RepID=UPI000EB139C6|nr:MULTISPECIES: prolyl oligopeptidase family serine peptidase [unclassified Flavobacterium]RKR05148.1 dipeptidyl aminopeptidase/acylaminoacyl peptidase [Flavobacterium sp. 81]TCK56463.1 dipeptidyl aminopeptidase/acylaminoacyl peptidase [Flavobacterium sp. 90]
MKPQNTFLNLARIGWILLADLKLVLFLFFILPLVACPLWGQVVQKKQLTQSDYHLFGELLLEKTSANGQWACYNMNYENDIDTLFVSSTTTQKSYYFPAGKSPTFAGNNNFICQTQNDLHILNLATKKQDLYTEIIQYAFSDSTDQIILLSQEHILKIVSLKNNAIQTFNDVAAFSMSPTQKEILISKIEDQKHSIGLLGLENNKVIKWIIEKSSHNFKAFTWHEKGKAVAFFGSLFQNSVSDDSRLYFYELKNKILLELNSKTQKNFPSGYILDQQMLYQLTISSDLQSLFFPLCIEETLSQNKINDTVEILSTRDKWIYPMEQKLGRFTKESFLAVWHPLSGNIIPISSVELPKVLLTGDQQYAILSNPKAYEPQFEEEGPRDFYIMDLSTGHIELLLEKQSAFYLDLLPSPSGKYISYYRDNNWWIYNIVLKKHVNITKEINIPFYGKVNILGADSAYGPVAWNSKDQEIILYDQYDLWSIKPDGASFKRITHGREKQIQFRINTLSNLDMFQLNFSGFKSKTIDLNKKLILRAQGNDGKTGYYKWTTQLGEKKIVYTDGHLDKMHSTENLDAYIYQEQRFDLPPRLMFKKNNLSSRSFFQSNPQFLKYLWGKSELIWYTNSEGKKLKGILYYPANHNPQEKYPMIVHIYERQSQDVHLFINPNLYASDGFNPTVLITKGYFVLCPDIEHEQGVVGKNAVDCTVSATNEIIKRNLVDPKKIGLMAHSFGGYEVNFIITQTNLFSAAISGASITDLDSFYLDVNWNSGASNFFRFQNEQWRMGKTLFEDPNLYDNNSPIRNASNIQTPLLLWSGKEDWHVNWHQTVELYMALRRFKKESVMLLYPKEKHILMNPKNQKDLNIKIVEWFDYYLKNNTPAPWITHNIK